MEKIKRKEKAPVDMLNGPLWGPLMRFALPVMFSSILQLLYNAADVLIVGRFAGSQALAAVGATSTLIGLIVNLFLGLSTGAGVVVAQNYGAGRVDQVQEAVHTAILLSILGGFAFMALGIVIAKPALGWMNTPEDVLDLSALYMRIYFLGMPFNMAYNFAASILRAMGDTRRPLIYLSISGIVNVVLNLVLVIVFHMSVSGVAIATVVSQILSAALTIACLIRTETCIRLFPKRLRLVPRQVKNILRLGIPSGLQSTVYGFSNTLIQAAVNGFGSAVVAGCAAAGSIDGFVYVCGNAFAAAAATFTGQNVGAGQFQRLKKIRSNCIVCACVVAFAAGLLACVFSRPLVSLYTSDAAAIDAGILKLWAVCLFYPLCGVMEVHGCMLQGMGCSTLPMVVSVTGACLLRVIWILTVFALFTDILVLYAVFPISWLATTIMYLIAYKRVRGNLVRCGAVDVWGRGKEAKA